ncbi:hypothetical protein J3R30DRAFT_3739337 [Lentinula aciculospora]|uniref:Uncharacterized protein n=1 Tax=Lentinula aciculospora TaxID=153920 RepID=A0A9W8ZWZ9_9AGAR|nr:hypothetical protein J3R30DRAFT_3739337 [Lentinula aciculospora]
MQLLKFVGLISLAAFACSVSSAAESSGNNVKVSEAVDTESVITIDVEIPDASATDGHVKVKVPLQGFSKASYSSLVAAADGQLEAYGCIPKGSVCTWGHWDCCPGTGCLLWGGAIFGTCT